MEAIIFYKSFFDGIEDLEEKQQLKIYKAIMYFAFKNEEIELNGIEKTIFKLIKPQLEASINNFINGKKGGRPKKTTGFEKEKPLVINQKTTGFETQKPNDNVNDNVNDNETDNNNEKKEKEKEKNDYALFIDYDFTKKTYDDGIKNKVFNFTNFDEFWIYYKDKGILKTKLHNLMIRWDIRWNEYNKKKAKAEEEPKMTMEEMKKMYGVIDF